MKIKLRTSFFILTLIFVGCAFVPPTWGLHDWAVNLGTGIIGTGLTVFLIDRVLERQEEARTARFVAIARGRLRSTLSRHAQLWATVYKACTPVPPAINPKHLSDFLQPDFRQHFVWFDGVAKAPVLPARTWAEYLSEQVMEFTKESEAVIDQFGTFMSAEEVEMISNCSHSDLVCFVRQLPTALSVMESKHFPIFHAMDGSLKKSGLGPFLIAHLEAVSKLISHLTRTEKALLISESTWSDSSAPKWASARVPN